MRVLMLCTRRGSEDGFTVRRFHAGQRYDMAEGLARYFLRWRWASHCRDNGRDNGEVPPLPLAPVAPVDAPFHFTFKEDNAW